MAPTALVACPVSFTDIPRPCWERLLAATPAATPFARWTFHRAWWDAYGDTAHEQYLACVPTASRADRIDWELVRAKAGEGREYPFSCVSCGHVAHHVTRWDAPLAAAVRCDPFCRLCRCHRN